MFTIIIVNWNGEKLLNLCLESLTKSSFKEFKICIVDNGSTDNSISVINKFSEKLKIEVIKLDKNTGFAYANNIGIKNCMGDESDYIITLNNDIEVREDTLDTLRAYIRKNKDVDVFQLMMINYFDRLNIDSSGMAFNENSFVSQLGIGENVDTINKLDTEIQGACAGAAVYSKKALREVCENEMDYFSSDFFAYYEDVDLALRLLSKGFKTHLVKEAVVYHMHSATGNKNSDFKDYYLTRNLFKYLKRNLPKDKYKKSAKRAYLNRIKLVVNYSVKGNFKGAKAIVKGLYHYNRNI